MSGPSDQRPDPLRGALPERAEPEPVADGAGRDLDHHDALEEGAGDDRKRHGDEHEEQEAADRAGEQRVGVSSRGALEHGTASA